jgi:hypothetical protein
MEGQEGNHITVHWLMLSIPPLEAA